MLTLSSLGGSSVSLSEGKATVAAFPKKPLPNAINLLSVPEEQPAGTTLSWPGEYDIAGVAIRGIGQHEGQQVSYTVHMDNVRIAFVSSPVEVWAQEDIERLGDVHVLVLPADHSKHCQELLDEIDPRLLVIVPGKDGDISADVLKATGAVGKEVVSEYKIKGSFPQEGREVIILQS